MGKLPAWMFYPKDWRTDSALCRCSKTARDSWLDMNCLMWDSEERGVMISGGTPWNDKEIAGAIRGDLATNLRDIAELLDKGVAFRDSRGAIFCKRMVRDEQLRQAATKRKSLSRLSHANVTGLSGDGYANAVVTEEKRKEPRRQEDRFSPTDNSDILIDQIVRMYPRNWRSKGQIQIPLSQSEACARAIARDGPELVHQGTEAYALAVAKWPIDQRKYCSNPLDFWNLSEYLKDAREFERSNGNGKPSKAKERFINNLRAVGLDKEAAKAAGAGSSGVANGPDAGDGTVIRGDPSRLLDD